MGLPHVADGRVQLGAPRLRLGALASGSGRTIAGIADACDQGALEAQLAVCVVTRPDVGAARRCHERGIPVAVVAPEPKENFDDRVDAALQAHGVELVCLCGYLRKLRVDAWRGRAVNIHPALLPEFGGTGMYGERVHAAVLDAGRAESGCTVHWVDEQYDHGSTILQQRCPVLPDDTPQTLAARVFAQEQVAYPKALKVAIAQVRGLSS